MPETAKNFTFLLKTVRVMSIDLVQITLIKKQINFIWIVGAVIKLFKFEVFEEDSIILILKKRIG